MSDNDFIIFGAPQITEDEIDEVVATLRSRWLGTGPKVAQFEQNFANFKGISSGLVAAVNSCTAALHVSMIAANLEPDSEVITTPMTFCATVNSIIHAGLKPVLADIEPDTFNIDPDQIEKKITHNTKAIIPVHFAGRPCNMDKIMSIAQKHNLCVIEDCAHAIESEYHGLKTGTFGNFGCFSFYVTKNVITGEGGMVVAKNQTDIDRVKMLALHGMTKDAWHRFGDSGYKHYHVVECGFKYNMMDLQAAIGIHQLNRVEANWRRRKHIWETYQSSFSQLPLTLPKQPDINTRHAYHLYTILVDPQKTGTTRDDILEKLTSQKIGTGVHYLSIPEHPFYKRTFAWDPTHYPHALKVGRQTISLPLSAQLSDLDVERVIKIVQNLFIKCPSI